LSDFKRLKVWEKAHAVALRVYTITRGFPREETYGLSSQMRRIEEVRATLDALRRSLGGRPKR
jgi:23S rRNA-intervening sequence protein